MEIGIGGCEPGKVEIWERVLRDSEKVPPGVTANRSSVHGAQEATKNEKPTGRLLSDGST